MDIRARGLGQNITETVRDRDSVPKQHQQLKTAYGKSNGHVTDDVT